MNILITQHSLQQRGGTEMYVYDLARKLIKNRHRVVVYSTQLGKLAHDLMVATVPVVDDLAKVQVRPDIIHGQHGFEVLTALLHFPNTPAVYVLHDWAWIFDKPPLLNRIRKYIAVDETCFDRLVVREGIPENRATILQNAVDLNRFAPRTPLPEKPKRALVFSNYASNSSIDIIRAACDGVGLSVDLTGAQAGNSTEHPEQLLSRYDLVFAKGRCAREALAVGCAVIVSDAQGIGQMVTSQNVACLARLNFGRRLLTSGHSMETTITELQKYDAQDAAEASGYIRENFGLDELVDRMVDIYRQAIEEFSRSEALNVEREYLQVSEYIRRWSTEMATKHLKANTSPLFKPVRKAA